MWCVNRRKFTYIFCLRSSHTRVLRVLASLIDSGPSDSSSGYSHTLYVAKVCHWLRQVLRHVPVQTWSPRTKRCQITSAPYRSTPLPNLLGLRSCFGNKPFRPLTHLELQSHFGDKPLKLLVVCPQNGTAVLKGLRRLSPKRDRKA